MNKKVLNKIYDVAIKAADPKKCIFESIKLEGENLFIKQKVYKISDVKDIYVISFGKSSIPMAEATEKILKGMTKEVLVISNEEPKRKLKKFKYVVSSHPIPNFKSLHAAKKAIKTLKKAGEKDLVIFLISGGGSSLMAMPISQIKLNEKKAIFKKLIKSGLDIKYINYVRKKISAIKGGKLLKYAAPASVCNLIISDVINGKPSDVASGPTIVNKQQSKTFINNIKNSDMFHEMSSDLKKVITKKEHSSKKVSNLNIDTFIISDNKTSLIEAEKYAQAEGFKTILYSTSIQGEAKKLGEFFGKLAIKFKTKNSIGRTCIIFGGETTVNVLGKGKGGRNMEMALSFSREIKNKIGISALFAGSDGIDGGTESAGAYCDYKTYRKANEKGLNIENFLKNNDSFNFFKKLKNLKITGNTGCNINDIGIILIEN